MAFSEKLSDKAVENPVQNTLVVIGGATATGKTALAIQLAQHFGTEILSADSRQLYRGMEIGTAKVTPAEQAAVHHHFIDTLGPDQPYSVGDFERDAISALNDIFSRNNIAILAGGSGLFVRAVCEGLDTFPEISPKSRQWVADGEQSGGLSWLQEQLAVLDPEYFAEVDQQNPARLRRALEVCKESGLPYTTFRSGQKQARPFHILYILLDLPRPQLYARIDARVDQMIAAGLEDEARRLLPYRDLPALRTVGYEEWFDFFDGKMSRETTIDKIKQHSRNYAKRQATWFRKHGAWQAFHPSQTEEIRAFVEDKINLRIG